MTEFRMPSLGSDMEAGTLVEWLVAPGDTVSRGDIVAVVETQKGAIEIETFEAGVVDRLVVEPGTEVPVGTVIAHIRGAGEPAAPEAPAPEAPEAKPKPKPKAPKPAAAKPAGPAPTRVRVSPVARRRAGQLGIDPETLAGTGPGGAVSLEDVERAAAAAPATAASATRAATPPDASAAMRRAIAAAMARSKREIPHYYLSTTIDLTQALDWLEAENRRLPVAGRLLYGALLVKATALALGEVPELNGFWRDDGFVPGPGIHVGAAIALRRGGLVAPAIHDTDGKDLGAVMQALRDLVQRARGGRLRASELSDPTVTVTSLGENGVEAVFPVIYPPQVAIVGFGSVVERPWSVDGRIESRRVITASLAADHRVSDGHRGALFLRALDRRLQDPETLA
ncbi:MAG: dihydrolipoamide acetyltransferase family protein [Thalassobaculum sp.]|uniref:dihydrolipoamide acetyltransferase family protein n=1 Tax=Thalassobaculum sp. TaxID=2022740 RepID=UPI0032EC8FB7